VVHGFSSFLFVPFLLDVLSARRAHHAPLGEGNESHTAKSVLLVQLLLEAQRVHFPVHLLVALPDDVGVEVHVGVHLFFLPLF
jgi:hypothetical protein